jgi:hypothetical protein
MITYHIVQLEAGALMPETAKRVVKAGKKCHTVFCLILCFTLLLTDHKKTSF